MKQEQIYFLTYRISFTFLNIAMATLKGITNQSGLQHIYLLEAKFLLIKVFTNAKQFLHSKVI